MTGIVNNTGARSGIIGTTVGTPAAGGANLDPGSGEVVVNDSSADVDFRVESDGVTNALFVNGGDGSVGFGNAAQTTVGDSSGSGSAYIGSPGNHVGFGRSSAIIFVVNRIADDGGLIGLRQNGTEEGTISVSGSTISYNGGHLSRWSHLADSNKDTSILKGTVLTNLNDMCHWEDEDGNVKNNDQLNQVAVSSVEGDPNVAGVMVNWCDTDEGQFSNTIDLNMAMTGDLIIRIAKDVTVEKGDLLMSAGDGTAKSQDDDIVRSKTIAKVISTHVTCTYDDDSYCVPCVVMAC